MIRGIKCTERGQGWADASICSSQFQPRAAARLSSLHLRLWWWWRQDGGSLSTSPYIWKDLIQIEHIKLKHEKRFSDKQCNWASWELLLKILEKTIDYSREGQTLEPWSTHIYYLLQLKSNNISSDWTAQTVWHAVWGCFGGAGGCLGGAWQVLRTF